MTFNPPYYEWTAANAGDAKNILNAVGKLIDAHVATVEPGGPVAEVRAARGVSAALTIRLDLSGAVAQINDRRALDTLGEELAELDRS